MLRKFKLTGNNYFCHVPFYSRGSDVVHAHLGEITVEGVYQAVGPNAEYQFFMNDYREGGAASGTRSCQSKLAQTCLPRFRRGLRDNISTVMLRQ